MDPQNLNSKNDVIDFFDASYLNIYSDLLDVELNDQLKFLETNYLRNITNNTKILDLCCGNGRHLCQLNNKYLVDGGYKSIQYLTSREKYAKQCHG